MNEIIDLFLMAKENYKELAKKHHPDKNNGKANNEFVLINTAFSRLKSLYKKHNYELNY